MKTPRAIRSSRLLVPLALAALLAGCRGGGTDPSEAEAFAARWQTLYNSHDVPGFTALYAEKGKYSAPGMFVASKDRLALRQVLTKIWHQHKDLRIAHVYRVVAGGDQIAVLFLATSRRPKGLVQAPGAAFFRIHDGLITEAETLIRW